MFHSASLNAKSRVLKVLPSALGHSMKKEPDRGAEDSVTREMVIFEVVPVESTIEAWV